MKKNFPTNKTKEWFAKLSYWAYLTGLPNFWIEELDFSDRIMRIHSKSGKVFHGMVFMFVSVQLLSAFTQHELTEKQQYMQIVFGAGIPFLCASPIIMIYFGDKLKSVFLNMTVLLKQVHNDAEIENLMIKQCVMYSIIFASAYYFTMILYGIEAVILMIRTGTTFNVVIPVWPIVTDHSSIANMVRLIYHVVWIMSMCQVVCVYVIVISLNTCASHQYKILQNYFERLNEVFLEENLQQNEKEHEYERKFKIGVQTHSDTLRVTYDIYIISNGIVCGQTVLCIIMLTILMYQTFVVTSERSHVKVMSAGLTALTMLFSTGFFMCNAGDVTYEASNVDTSMYASGWQNCHGATSIRIRKLLIVAMSRAQMPLKMKCLGIIELSHRSFLSVVKCSYSIFSLLY